MSRGRAIGALVLASALSACGDAAAPTNATAPSVVRVTLPDEPAAPWKGEGAALVERNCLACHSAEMIATQPPLTAEKWQASIDKMRSVYKARIDPADDAALVAALMGTQAMP